MIKKSFNLDKEEFVDFSKENMIRVRLNTIIIVGVLLLVGSFLLTFKSGIKESLFLSLCMAAFYFIFVLVFSILLTSLEAKSIFKKKHIGDYKYEVEFSENGIKQNKVLHSYLEFKLIKETKRLFIFNFPNKTSIIVPKRIFTNDELVKLKNILISNKNIKKIKLHSTNKKEK